MIHRFALSVVLAAGLSSCGLVRLPFRVAGAVVEGTADVGRSTYDASRKAFGKSEEEKAKEKKEKEAAAKLKAEEEQARRSTETLLHAEANRRQSESPSPEPLPVDDSLPPLPDDAPLPYDAR